MFKISKKFAKNFITILLGIFFTIIIIEISLLVFGKLKKQLNQKNNNLSKKDEFIILALGESTTALIYDFKMQDYSWPAILEELLNEAGLEKKVKVVNVGMSGINSKRILKDLENNIEKYEPDLVISMMGINDFFEEITYEAAANIEADSLLSEFRTYKLIKFFISDLQTKKELRSKQKIDCYSETQCIDLAIVQKTDDYFETKTAIKLLEKALIYNPNSTNALLDLGYRYMSDYNINRNRDYFKSVTLFKKALENDLKNPKSYFALIKNLTYIRETIENTLTTIEYMEAITDHIPNYKMSWLEYSGQNYRQKFKETIENNYRKIEKDIEKNEIDNESVFLALASFFIAYEDILNDEKSGRLFWLEKALEMKTNNLGPIFGLARYNAQHDNFKEAEKFYLKILENEKKDDVYIMSLIELANIYLETNRKELANKYFKQAIEIGGMYTKNYQTLYQILKAHDIQLIAVQYPMRSIEPLELIFQNNTDVLLVDNELLFKNLIKEESYQALFVDRFAGDFGHCSERGNLFLAENIKSVILENWEEINGEN